MFFPAAVTWDWPWLRLCGEAARIKQWMASNTDEGKKSNPMRPFKYKTNGSTMRLKGPLSDSLLHQPRLINFMLCVHLSPPPHLSTCMCVAVQWIQDSGIDIGDISERKALRKRLQCKTFRWYLVNIYPEMRMYSETIAYGVVRRWLPFHPKLNSVPAKARTRLNRAWTNHFNPSCWDPDGCSQEHKQFTKKRSAAATLTLCFTL